MVRDSKFRPLLGRGAEGGWGDGDPDKLLPPVATETGVGPTPVLRFPLEERGGGGAEGIEEELFLAEATIIGGGGGGGITDEFVISAVGPECKGGGGPPLGSELSFKGEIGGGEGGMLPPTKAE